MNNAEEVLRRQEEWQRSQASLPWALKVRMAESVRASIEHLQRQRLPAKDMDGSAAEAK